jgi:hypothetical protein
VLGPPPMPRSHGTPGLASLWSAYSGIAVSRNFVAPAPCHAGRGYSVTGAGSCSRVFCRTEQRTRDPKQNVMRRKTKPERACHFPGLHTLCRRLVRSVSYRAPDVQICLSSRPGRRTMVFRTINTLELQEGAKVRTWQGTVPRYLPWVGRY